MLTVTIVLSSLLMVLLIVFIVWRIRTRRFKPNPNKQLQQKQINDDLEPTGFAYELKGDYFYTLMDCWQREAGYCRLYDEGAPLFNMVMDCEPIAFRYAGKRWLIELWKGQYGITTGAEIGVYNTSRPDLNTELVSGTFFESASDSERLQMSLVLRKNGTVLLRRRALHWWLAAFRLGEFSQTAALTMDAKIKFPNREMCAAFVESLRNTGYQRGEFSVMYTTVRIHFTKPHSPQPMDPGDVQIMAVQQVNKNNCGLFETATRQYPDTLDKLEYLKAAMPELYHLFLHSLYAKGFFAAFDLIRDALREQDESGAVVLPEQPEPPVCSCCPPSPCQPVKRRNKNCR